MSTARPSALHPVRSSMSSSRRPVVARTFWSVLEMLVADGDQRLGDLAEEPVSARELDRHRLAPAGPRWYNAGGAGDVGARLRGQRRRVSLPPLRAHKTDLQVRRGGERVS